MRFIWNLIRLHHLQQVKMFFRICAVLAGIVILFVSFVVAQNPLELTKHLQTSATLLGQADTTKTNANPFELTTRLQNTLMPTEQTDAVFAVSANPFDIARSRTAAESVVSAIPNASKTSTNPKQQDQVKGANEFFITLLAVVPVTLLFMAFRPQFGKAYQNVLNFNILQQSYREFKGAFIFSTNVWYLVFWINGGIFLALVANRFGFSITQHILMDALIGIATVSGLLLVKHIVNRLLQQIYIFHKELGIYNYLLMLLGTVLGVLLVPVNLILTYADSEFIHILIYLTSLFLVVAFIFLAIRGIIIGNTYLPMHGFHFLLYICAVEIAPILILIKVGLVFINK